MGEHLQRVVVKGEDRKLSFRALDVEQIGYVYEGLLSFEGRRAADTVVGLIGKRGLEEETALTDLEAHAAASPTFAFSALGFWGTCPEDQPAQTGVRITYDAR